MIVRNQTCIGGQNIKYSPWKTIQSLDMRYIDSNFCVIVDSELPEKLLLNLSNTRFE